ncbi:hypothetical protein ACWPKO_06965 [Coraliomargarita sp. W4R53]
MTDFNPKSFAQSVATEDGVLRLGSKLRGDVIEIQLSEVKKVKEDFPNVTIILKGNRRIRVAGRNLKISVYAQFLHTLKEHETFNQQINKRLNQSE